jgi:hypothetical protein
LIDGKPCCCNQENEILVEQYIDHQVRRESEIRSDREEFERNAEITRLVRDHQVSDDECFDDDGRSMTVGRKKECLAKCGYRDASAIRIEGRVEFVVFVDGSARIID